MVLFAVRLSDYKYIAFKAFFILSGTIRIIICHLSIVGLGFRRRTSDFLRYTLLVIISTIIFNL